MEKRIVSNPFFSSGQTIAWNNPRSKSDRNERKEEKREEPKVIF